MAQPGGPPRRPVNMANGMVEDANRRDGRPRCAADHEPNLFDMLARAALRQKISQKRFRFEYQRVNLDMAYITDRIIAVGYPASKMEKNFRNSMKDTREMLWRRHGSHHVKVFNLRGGYLYNPAKFDNNVIYMDMTDHHPPKLELMAPFCREAYEWLLENPENVIAVHCKAGKGRTGVMICALLIYIQYYSLPREVLDYYSIVRTMNNQGVTIPSQRRYIYYYAHLRKKNLNYFPLRMQLIGVYIERPPKSAIEVTVSNGSKIVFTPRKLSIRNYSIEKGSWKNVSDKSVEEGMDGQPTYISQRAYCFMVPKTDPVFVEGDVRVDLLNGENKFLHPTADRKIGHVWFNTMFVCDQDFVYGDKKYPYTPDRTAIGRKEIKPPEVMMPDFSKPDCDPAPHNSWKIVQPPNLNAHAPDESLQRIYRNYGMPSPRQEISARLYLAHKQGLVKDIYQDRQLKTQGDAYVPNGDEKEFTGVGGPYVIPLKEGEHVLTFPVYEIDRALKNKDINDGMKMHVVLRCIDSADCEVFAQSEKFCNETFMFEQGQRASANRDSSRMTKYPPSAPLPDAIGAERMAIPAVRYGHDGGYDGTPATNLGDTKFKDSKLAKTDRYCRFYYKQRENDSDSEYPPDEHTCRLTNKTFRHSGSEDRDGDGNLPGPSGT